METRPSPHMLLSLVQNSSAPQTFLEKYPFGNFVPRPLVLVLVHFEHGLPLLYNDRVQPALRYYVVPLYWFDVCVMGDQVVDAEAAECQHELFAWMGEQERGVIWKWMASYLSRVGFYAAILFLLGITFAYHLRWSKISLCPWHWDLTLDRDANARTSKTSALCTESTRSGWRTGQSSKSTSSSEVLILSRDSAKARCNKTSSGLPETSSCTCLLVSCPRTGLPQGNIQSNSETQKTNVQCFFVVFSVVILPSD